MSLKKITAIIQESMLSNTISALQKKNIPGVTVSHVKGYGEYINTFSRDSLQPSVKLDIIVKEKDVHTIAEIIMESAGTSSEGDGIVAVTPMDGLYRIRDRKFIS